jgi:lactate permease
VTVPVTVATWVGAAVPVAILLYLLVWRRWSAVRASVAGLLAAALVAVTLYRSPASVLGVEVAKGVWNSLSIIAVIIPAMLIYEISHEVKAFPAIERELARLVPDKLLQVLALGWCFASFLQGPSGFGVPIAVTAPLLIGIGVKPFWAVLVPLMAHAWANTFGTLALAWEVLVQQTTLGSNPGIYWQAAWWTGILTGLLCILAGIAICWQYRGWAGLRHGWPAILILGGIQAGGQLVLSQVTPTLAVVIPTTLALGAVFALARLPMYLRQGTSQASPMLEARSASTQAPVSIGLHEAMLPYYTLVGISVVILLTPSIAAALGSWKMSIAFPQTVTGYGFVNKASPQYGPVAWLTHSGFFLLLAALLSAAYFSATGAIRKGTVVPVLRNAFAKSVPAALSVALLLAMSKIMGGSGQVDVLARGTAAVAGGNYVFLAALIGTLGAFMSSSNVSSNILFAQFQESVARLTGKVPAIILAAQTSGAAIGTMFAPSKVLLGTTTAGIVGQEGAVIRKLLGIALTAAIVMGVVVFCYA